MQLTKGAIGNLINRYRAVLKKCHLLNVFGSLAVAGMLVMGGAAAAGAADSPITVEDTEKSVTVENLNITGTDKTPAIQVTNGTLTIVSTNNITLAHGSYTAPDGKGEYSKMSLFTNGGTVSLNSDTLTFIATNPTVDPPSFAGTGDNAAVLAGDSNMSIDVTNLYVGSQEQGGDRGFRLVGQNNRLTIHADKIVSYTGDEFVHVRNNAENSIAYIGTADNHIGYFEAHTTWGKDDYGVAILQANEGGTINFYADTALFDGSLNDTGGVFGSGSYGTVNVNSTKLTIDGNMCATYGTMNSLEGKIFALNVSSDSIDMDGDVNAGSMNSGYSNTNRKTNVNINASDFLLVGDINAWERASIAIKSNNLTIDGQIVAHNIGNEETIPNIVIDADNFTIAPTAEDASYAVKAEKGNINLSAAIQGVVTGNTAMVIGADGKVTTAGIIRLEGDNALSGQGALINSGDLTFNGATSQFTGTFTQTAGNTFLEGDYFGGDVNVQGGSLEAKTMTIASGKTTAVSGGTVSIENQLDLTSGTLSVTAGTASVAQGGGITFGATADSLSIAGGTFVADAATMLNQNSTALDGVANALNVQSGNLNLRWFDGDYTADEYASVKQALMDSVGENATLNFLNANLKLDEGQDLVVGAKQEDNVVTIQTAPVVVATDEAPSDAADKVITSVPDQIVSVVTNDEDKKPLEADTIIVSDSKFTAKGLEIAGTATPDAEAVTLKVTGNSDITLTGGEAGFTGVVNAENEAVATNVEVSNASLTVGLEGNASAQNLTLNEVTVDGGTFEVAGNGLDTTQVEASTLTTKESGTVAVNNATLTVQETVVSTGVLSITNAVSDLGTVDFSGGVLFFDPSYNTHTFKDGIVGGLFLTSDGSVINVDSGLDNLQELAQKAGLTTTAIGSGKFTLGTGQSMLALGQNLTLSGSGQVIVDAGVTYEDTGSQQYVAKIDGQNISDGAYFGNNSLLVVNGNTIKGATAAITLGGTNTDLYVQNGAKLLIADAVAGQTYTVIANADNADTAFNGTSYTNASATGWKDANLLTSSDMVTLTSEDGTVFKSVSADAHTVFPNLSHELATAVNTLYGQQLNDVDADAMGVRFLSRATDNRYLGADKQAAASTIESAARMAFAGAVPQMTRMASDAGTNAVVNRLGFANPADGAQAMNAEGKIVDRNTTGFALWIAPLWQNQHGWGMEAGNLDYGFNGNLGGVSLGADYTFENAIRAGITFNIGGGYAESSGGDLNSTENRMTFWGLGAYAGWNYENFGLMADVSYTSTWNDLEQDMDGRMGMGDLEADVQATAISAGLRAEYKLETSVLDIIPHIGVRYMSLNTWGYDVDTNGGTVLEGDGFHQDIWTFPIGVTFSKDFTLDSGWFFKPSVDFSVIPAAGDIKAKQDVAFTGLPGTYEVETQMMDYLTWQGGVGIQMGNDNLSFGVNYTLQAGQNTTGHGVFGSFRYEF